MKEFTWVSALKVAAVTNSREHRFGLEVSLEYISKENSTDLLTSVVVVVWKS